MSIKPQSPEWLFEFLKNEGFVVTKVSDWYMMKCPFHEESRPSFGVHIEDGGYNCFACHKSGTFDNLLSELNIDVVGVDVDAPSPIDYKRVIDGFKNGNNKVDSSCSDYSRLFNELEYCDKREVNDYYNYALSRGLCRRVVKSLHIGVVKDVRYLNRIVFPVLNRYGNKVLWYEGRAIKKSLSPKYWRPKGSPTKTTLYNYHKVKKYSNVVVVEGVIDASILFKWGIPSVCCFGSKLHIEQLVQLINFEKINFCFDADRAGSEALKKIRDELRIDKNFGSEFYSIRLPKGHDVADLNGKSDFIKSYNKKKMLF